MSVSLETLKQEIDAGGEGVIHKSIHKDLLVSLSSLTDVSVFIEKKFPSKKVSSLEFKHDVVNEYKSSLVVLKLLAVLMKRLNFSIGSRKELVNIADTNLAQLLDGAEKLLNKSATIDDYFNKCINLYGGYFNSQVRSKLEMFEKQIKNYSSIPFHEFNDESIFLLALKNEYFKTLICCLLKNKFPKRVDCNCGITDLDARDKLGYFIDSRLINDFEESLVSTFDYLFPDKVVLDFKNVQKLLNTLFSVKNPYLRIPVNKLNEMSFNFICGSILREYDYTIGSKIKEFSNYKELQVVRGSKEVTYQAIIDRGIDIFLKHGGKTMGVEIEREKENYLYKFISKLLFFGRFVDKLIFVLPASEQRGINEFLHRLNNDDFIILPKEMIDLIRSESEKSIIDTFFRPNPFKKIVSENPYHPLVFKSFYTSKPLFISYIASSAFDSLSDYFKQKYNDLKEKLLFVYYDERIVSKNRDERETALLELSADVNLKAKKYFGIR